MKPSQITPHASKQQRTPTTQGAKTNMNKHRGGKYMSKVSYLHPRVMATMEV